MLTGLHQGAGIGGLRVFVRLARPTQAFQVDMELGSSANATATSEGAALGKADTG
jgi:hypothetical protein